MGVTKAMSNKRIFYETKPWMFELLYGQSRERLPAEGEKSTLEPIMWDKLPNIPLGDGKESLTIHEHIYQEMRQLREYKNNTQEIYCKHLMEQHYDKNNLDIDPSIYDESSIPTVITKDATNGIQVHQIVEADPCIKIDVDTKKLVESLQDKIITIVDKSIQYSIDTFAMSCCKHFTDESLEIAADGLTKESKEAWAIMLKNGKPVIDISGPTHREELREVFVSPEALQEIKSWEVQDGKGFDEEDKPTPIATMKDRLAKAWGTDEEVTMSNYDEVAKQFNVGLVSNETLSAVVNNEMLEKCCLDSPRDIHLVNKNNSHETIDVIYDSIDDNFAVIVSMVEGGKSLTYTGNLSFSQFAYALTNNLKNFKLIKDK